MKFSLTILAVFAATAAALHCDEGQPVGLAECTCAPEDREPFSGVGNPTQHVRCCKGDFRDDNDDYFGACDTSSCVNNFGQTNRNCFNYGSSEFPLSDGFGTATAGNGQGGSKPCPYLKEDKAICDLTFFVTYNNGNNCRTAGGSHCLGKVRCGSSGVDVSQGPSNGLPTDPLISDTCSRTVISDGEEVTYTEGQICFYDGTSDNWKVCDPEEPIWEGGDPHFFTWGREFFDYMGECDLVLSEAPGFGQGLGFAVHIRTKIRYDYSFIESAAIKIGEDVLEIGGYGAYMINGVSNAELPFNMMDLYTITKTAKNDHDVTFDIYIPDEKSHLKIKAFKDLISFQFPQAEEQTFGDVVGMLGSFNGTRFARDGVRVIQDNTEFAQEWQVRPDHDPELFQVKSGTQYPAQCKLPSIVKEGRRRLGENISYEAATKACENVYKSKRMIESCVYDVIATGDLEVAAAGAF